jgi:Holliday junction resolvase-like predicted endonuclease
MNGYDYAKLHAALKSAESWEELFVMLGLSSRPGGNTAQNVRRTINEFGLSSSHLNKQTGPKTAITHQSIESAIQESSSWSEVAKKLQCSHNTAKTYALKFGIDFEKITNRSAAPSVAPLTAPHGRQQLHNAAESLAAYWYEANGYEVFRPLTDGGTDLLISDGGIFSRVQVKSSVSKSNAVGISRNGHKGYLSTEVDEFFVVMADSRIYRLPFDAVGAKVSLVMSSKYDKYRVELF